MKDQDKFMQAVAQSRKSALKPSEAKKPEVDKESKHNRLYKKKDK